MSPMVTIDDVVCLRNDAPPKASAGCTSVDSNAGRSVADSRFSSTRNADHCCCAYNECMSTLRTAKQKEDRRVPARYHHRHHHRPATNPPGRSAPCPRRRPSPPRTDRAHAIFLTDTPSIYTNLHQYIISYHIVEYIAYLE